MTFEQMVFLVWLYGAWIRHAAKLFLSMHFSRERYISMHSFDIVSDKLNSICREGFENLQGRLRLTLFGKMI